MDPLVIEPAWEGIDIRTLTGRVLIVGETDSGKSTLARYLFERLSVAGRAAAYLDGDPGQGTLGPPGTVTAAIGQPGAPAFPPAGPRWQRFIGATSPRGHMLPMVAAAGRLVEAAQAAGADVILHDTSGLIDGGGLALKLALVDLLRPATVIAIQRRAELEPLLAPLRRMALRVVVLRPAAVVRRRSATARRAARAERFAAYFKRARPLKLELADVAVLPGTSLSRNRVVSVEDGEGFVRALALVTAVDQPVRRATLLTPLAEEEPPRQIRVGDIVLDPTTYRDAAVTPSSE